MKTNRCYSCRKEIPKTEILIEDETGEEFEALKMTCGKDSCDEEWAYHCSLGGIEEAARGFGEDSPWS